MEVAETMNVQKIDLVARARKALNYLTTNPMRETGYLMYLGGKIPEKGLPYFERTPWDHLDGTGRILEALEFIRRMTGVTEGAEVERGMWHIIESCSGSDGFYHAPTAQSKDEIDLGQHRAVLLALSSKYEKTKDKKTLERMRIVIDELWKKSVGRDGFIFVGNKIDGCDQWSVDAEHGYLFLTDSLVRVYETTGYERALDLAIKIVSMLVASNDRIFNDDGSFIFRGVTDKMKTQVSLTSWVIDGKKEFMLEPEAAYVVYEGHVHSRTVVLQALSMLGGHTGQKDFVEMAARGLDWLTANHGSSFGWFAENALISGKECSEMCCLTDVLGVLLRLVDLGYENYWDLICRYTVNHLFVAQFSKTEKLMDVLEENLKLSPPVITDDSRSYERVLERFEGGFAGPIYPDDLFCYYPKSRYNSEATRTIDISGCCSPSGAKALYLVWERIFDRTDDGYTINLPLTKETPEFSVNVDRGERQTLSVRAESACKVKVRIPNFAQVASVRVNSASVSSEGPKNQIEFNHPGADREILVDYLVNIQTTDEEVGGLHYQINWLGDFIVDMRSDYESLLNPYKNRW